MNQHFREFLEPTPTIDSDHPDVAAYANKNAQNTADDRDAAVKLYYAVRDDIRYDPYALDISVAGLQASKTLATRRGWCVAKAILLAACCRAMGIPARLGFADVRNHLSTERLRAQMQTDIFYYHGYTSIYLNGKWLKATPAFNIELCEKFRIRPLEFDGTADSIYHPFDLDGNQHMEYLANRGEFADVPLQDMIDTFTREYLKDREWQPGDFDKDVEAEVGGMAPAD